MNATRYSLKESKEIQTKLQALDLLELDKIYAAGEVPKFEEFEGKTSGAWLAKPPEDYWWAKWFIRVFLDSPWARWTGKAFLARFDERTRGTGANLFDNRFRPVRYRLNTFIKKAEVDDRLCLTLKYPFGSIMYGLIDDVRKIDEEVLLGQMHYRFFWRRNRVFIGYFCLCPLRAELDDR